MQSVVLDGRQNIVGPKGHLLLKATQVSSREGGKRVLHRYQKTSSNSKDGHDNSGEEDDQCK